MHVTKQTMVRTMDADFIVPKSVNEEQHNDMKKSDQFVVMQLRPDNALFSTNAQQACVKI